MRILSFLTLLCVLTEEPVAYNYVSPERVLFRVCLNTCAPTFVSRAVQKPESLIGCMVITMITL
jgi:hypothetical protein